jgi:poly-gamma-glutamate capsule biosynthesis protein CapA/YwtB (metallophosphatase superfamily)
MRSSLRVHAPALSLLLVSLPGLAAAQAARADTHPDPQEMHIALTGDSIINRRLSVYDDAATVKLFDALRRNEVVFTNFETLIHPDTDPGAAVSGGAYQSSPAWTADELKWAGFNLLSVANNHAFDFGMQGMLSNLKALDEAGLTYAGAGENLARARGAGYLDTRRGRVALIALASTFTEGSFASEQRPDLAGRPGIDPLRVTTRYTVDPATFDDLKRLSAAQGSGEGGAGPRNAVRIGTLRFQAGEKDSVITEADPADVKGLLESIKNAHRQADWVIVSSHTHECRRTFWCPLRMRRSTQARMCS